MSRSDLPRIKTKQLVGPLLAGVVESESEPGQAHVARIMLDGNSLCGCKGSLLGGHTCKHLKALLESLEKDALIDWIVTATSKPAP